MTMSLEETAQTTTIRVVFDGAPFAGKTTAARSLSEALGGSVTSPEEEDGRTLWFDWMTYSAGHHEGRAIRVELVTVPGQSHLAARRRHLIEWGDVIVFIANTSEAVFADSVARYHQLRAELASHGSKPVIVIANKRDLMDAMPLADVCEQLGVGEDDVVIEGVATAGGGIRSAFIHAVRAAIEHSFDRIDEMTAEDLLGEMQAALAAAEADAATHMADPESATDHREPAANDGVVTRVEFATSDESEPLPMRSLPEDPTPSGTVQAPVVGSIPAAVVAEAAAAAARAADPTPAPMAASNPLPQPVRLDRDAIADGEAVVVFAQHWRTIVDVALGADPAHYDADAIAELTEWGLLIADSRAVPATRDAALPSDDTDVPSPVPGVAPALAIPSPAVPAPKAPAADAADDLPPRPPSAANRAVMF